MRERRGGWCELAHGHAGLSQSLWSCPLVMVQHLYPSPLLIPIFIAAELLTVKPVLKQWIKFPQNLSGAVRFTEKSQTWPV